MGNSTPKDNWDKAAVIGNLLLPIVVAIVGLVFSYYYQTATQRAQLELEQQNAKLAEINSRVAQTGAVATLLDALTGEGCGTNMRKTVAIKLVYYVLPEETANDVLLALSLAADTRCAAAAVDAFQQRLPPELADAQETVLTSQEATAVESASQLLQTSRYASLVLPAVIEAAERSPNDQSLENIVVLLNSEATLRVAESSPLLTESGRNLQQSDRFNLFEPNIIENWPVTQP